MGIKSKYKNSTEMFYYVNRTGHFFKLQGLFGPSSSSGVGFLLGWFVFFINIFVEQKLFPYAFHFKGGESCIQHKKLMRPNNQKFETA